MMWWLTFLTADAIEMDLDFGPVGFARLDRDPTPTRYRELQGDGPVYGRWRNRSGAILAHRFRDGVVEHADVYDGRTLTHTYRYGAHGRRTAAVDWTTESVTLDFAPPGTVSVGAWPWVTVGERALRMPPGFVVSSPGNGDGGGIRLVTQPAADPFTDRFRAEISAVCACEIEAWETVWIDGLAAAHYRLRRGGDQPVTADLVVWPSDEGNRVFSAVGPDERSLLVLRAALATARPEAP